MESLSCLLCDTVTCLNYASGWYRVHRRKCETQYLCPHCLACARTMTTIALPHRYRQFLHPTDVVYR